MRLNPNCDESPCPFPDDEGDNFYVIESGTCNILIQPNPDAEPVHKSTIGPGASFGELALMYGTPRAASVQV